MARKKNPKGTGTTQIGVVIAADLLARLDHRAKVERRTRSQLAALILEDALATPAAGSTGAA